MIYRYLSVGLLVFAPHVVHAHTGDDVHNALGIFGHPVAVAVVLLVVVLVGMVSAIRVSTKKNKSDDISK